LSWIHLFVARARVCVGSQKPRNDQPARPAHRHRVSRHRETHASRHRAAVLPQGKSWIELKKCMCGSRASLCGVSLVYLCSPRATAGACLRAGWDTGRDDRHRSRKQRIPLLHPHETGHREALVTAQPRYVITATQRTATDLTAPARSTEACENRQGTAAHFCSIGPSHVTPVPTRPQAARHAAARASFARARPRVAIGRTHLSRLKHCAAALRRSSQSS
jgi:hypothetical protein